MYKEIKRSAVLVIFGKCVWLEVTTPQFGTHYQEGQIRHTAGTASATRLAVALGVLQQPGWPEG
jgi:hypothetical protein